MLEFERNRGATEGGSTFAVKCDWHDNQARIAMVSADGVELFMIVPVEIAHMTDRDEITAAIFKECEARLRNALLSLIAKNWPSET